jgi:hypothetical protein
MSLRTTSRNRVSNFTFTNSQSGGGSVGTSSVSITSIVVTDSNFNNLDDTAIATSNSYIKIIGSGFNSSANIWVAGTKLSSGVTYVNSTEIRVTMPAVSLGNTNIFVFNPDNSGAIWAPGLLVSGTPEFSQTAYTSSTPLEVSIQLLATGDATLTYALQAGSSLPGTLTLSSSGLISGATVDGVYQFTVIVSDAQLQSFQQQITLTISSADANFKSTVLVINADTNTFVRDASSNNFAVTINGDTKPSVFSPYNTNWSNLFDGSGDYLSIAANSSINLGTGDFTVEAWIYATVATQQQYGCILANHVTNGWYVAFNASNQIYWSNHTTVAATSSTAITPFKWIHVAVTRSGTSLKIFQDGVEVASATNSTAYGDSAAALLVGQNGVGNYFTGYISNARVLKGTALYTSAFTPPTQQLTAITNTSVLTCQSNRLIDNSTNNLAITKYGDVKVTAFGPFTETDTTTGSSYFDGTGDYLTVPNNNDFNLPGDFTLEFWINNNSVSSSPNYICVGSSSATNNGLLIYYSNGATSLRIYSNGAALIAGPSLINNVWYHIALVRSGSGSNNLKLYVNGVSAGQATSTTTFTGVAGNGVAIGSEYTSSHSIINNYYMSDVRIVKGTAVYTSAFTPPTVALTAVANTSLLTLQTRQPVNNHTFIDESGLNNIVTRNGNPSQGSSSPFSPAGWSNYLDGTGDYLSIPTSNSLMHQIGNWTYEGWIYWNSMPTTGYQNIFGQGAAGQSSYGLTAYNGSSWSAPYKFVVNQANIGNRITGTTTLVAGTWYHFAVVRNSGIVTLYVNGTAEGTFSDSTDYAFGGNAFMIGNSSNGYISNFRFNRSAVYTSNFTPSTTALAAIANTSLLTCQSNRLIDNSNNAFTITRNGDTRVVNFSPFAPTVPYSLVTHGGSAYFDGSDYLQTNSTDSGLIRTGPFTIELWVYPLSLNTTLLSRFYWQTGDNGGWVLATNSSGFVTFSYSTGAWNGLGGVTATTNPVVINQWNHIAVTRDTSNTLRIFVNGNSAVTPITLAQSLDTVAVQQAGVQPRTFRVAVSGLGDGALSGYYTGYISSVKIQTGVAKYTANSIPALQTFSNESGINYLSNMNTMGIVDVSSRNVLETVGDAKIRTDVKKYGTGSMYFDGTGDYLVLTGNVDNFVFGVGDFTIEFWLYLNANQTSIVYDQRASGAQGLYPELYINTNSIRYYTNSADRIVGSTLNNQQWYHIALARSGTATKLFVNGTQSGSTYTDSNNYINGTNRPVIGASASSLGSDPFNGYIDDLRITKGVARYTANFTPPTSTILTQ